MLPPSSAGVTPAIVGRILGQYRVGRAGGGGGGRRRRCRGRRRSGRGRLRRVRRIDHLAAGQGRKRRCRRRTRPGSRPAPDELAPHRPIHHFGFSCARPSAGCSFHATRANGAEKGSKLTAAVVRRGAELTRVAPRTASLASDCDQRNRIRAGAIGRGSGQPSSVRHISVSRSAVQMRGCDVARRFVVGARDVEWHAVIEDHPVAVDRLKRGVDVLVRRAQLLAGGDAGADVTKDIGDEGARRDDRLVDAGRRLERRAAAGDQLGKAEGLEAIERRRPVAEVAVAAVGRALVLDQVAGETDLLVFEIGDRVALGVAAADLLDLDLDLLAEPYAELAFERHRRPAEAGRHRLDIAEQAREAADLARLVLLAALDNQLVRVAAGDDLLRAFLEIGRSAEHAHRVVVGEQHVLDRQRRDLADAPDEVLRHRRRRLRVGHHHRLVADEDTGVRIALGGVCVGVLREARERDLLVFQIGLAGECLAHGGFLAAPTRQRLAGRALTGSRSLCGWWRGGGSNSRPSHCERDALPAELPPHCDRKSSKRRRGGGRGARIARPNASN